jgi:hypothetical protein
LVSFSDIRAFRLLAETTHVHFAENPISLLEAYADSGEDIDRAGGYAIQGLGGMLVNRIEGGKSLSKFPIHTHIPLLLNLLPLQISTMPSGFQVSCEILVSRLSPLDSYFLFAYSTGYAFFTFVSDLLENDELFTDEL